MTTSLALDRLQGAVQERLLGTRIVKSTFSGSVTIAQYRAYLTDVYCYAVHSAPVIGLAATRLVHSHPPLAAYLLRHAGEEMGHEAWAAADLAELGATSPEIESAQPSSACLRLIGLEYLYATHANPIGLFGWMFVLESLGGSVGGRIGEQLDRTLHLEGRALRFLKGHADADAHHSRELFEVIARHVSNDGDSRCFERVAEESVALYCGILDAAADSEPPRP